jgi:hypothetical protein
LPTTHAHTEAATERRRRLAPEHQPVRGHQHDQLAVFAGRWQAEGQAYGADEGRMFSNETWEWLSGGFFLAWRFDSRLADGRHKGVGHLGWDAARQTHTCRMIDNMGYDRLYDLSVNGQVWSFRGDRERATYVFSDDGRSIDIRWESSDDGIDFRPLCELKATRVGGLGPTRH